MLFNYKYFLKIFPKSFGHSRKVHKYLCNMNKAYLRYLDGMEKFDITFQYVAPEHKVNRQFNFSRNSSETISTFLSRLNTNVEKVVKKKNKQFEDNIKSTVFLNNEKVDDSLSCKEVFLIDNQIKLIISNIEFDVIINSPWLSAFGLSGDVMAGFYIYVNKFEGLHVDKNLSTFEWYKSRDKKEWIVVGDSFYYKPSNLDIDFYLKLCCTPRNERIDGATVEVITTEKVKPGPGECPFELRHKFTTERCKDKSFRVVTYNILADLYCSLDYTKEVLHPYCPAYALNIDYRKQLIIKELLGYNADIICLQEVDRKVYKQDLKTILEEFDFDSDLCLKGGEVAEGCALFFNKKRFKRIHNERFVLSERIHVDQHFKDIWSEIEKNQELKERILDKATVLQVNVLEMLDSNEIIVVANTHFYFHPDADHIRLLQGGIAIKHLERILQVFQENNSDKRVSLIFCGDFNSTPDCGVYQLYTTGKVEKNHKDYQSKPSESVQVELQQNLQLKSACGTPQVTNYIVAFSGCLDYIYYQSDNLQVEQVVPLPSFEEITQHIALPSVVMPSDHIALVADLKFNT